MHNLKTSLAVFMLSTSICGQALANEYFFNISTAGTAEAVNLGAANTALLPGSERVVHGLVITNSDTTAPVTVSFFKVTDTTTTTTTGTGKNAKTTSTTAASSPVLESIVVVAANSTTVIPLQAGLPFVRTSSNVVDDLLVELTTTSKQPNVHLTIDYQDVVGTN